VSNMKPCVLSLATTKMLGWGLSSFFLHKKANEMMHQEHASDALRVACAGHAQVHNHRCTWCALTLIDYKKARSEQAPRNSRQLKSYQGMCAGSCGGGHQTRDRPCAHTICLRTLPNARLVTPCLACSTLTNNTSAKLNSNSLVAIIGIPVGAAVCESRHKYRVNT
jgi:hypothetical protein